MPPKDFANNRLSRSNRTSHWSHGWRALGSILPKRHKIHVANALAADLFLSNPEQPKRSPVGEKDFAVWTIQHESDVEGLKQRANVFGN